MKITTTILAFAVFLTGVLMTQYSSFAQDTCEVSSKPHKLVIIVTDNRPTKVVHAGEGGANADVITVCIGDQIEWHLVGSRAYYIKFGDGKPFGGADRRDSNANGKILVTVVGPPMPDPGHKYDIGIVDGDLWDPRIIIAR